MYDTITNTFMGNLDNLLGEVLSIGTGMSFVLLIWDTKKNKLYGDQDGETSGCSCSCPLTTSSACICGCVVNGISAMAVT